MRRRRGGARSRAWRRMDVIQAILVILASVPTGALASAEDDTIALVPDGSSVGVAPAPLLSIRYGVSAALDTHWNDGQDVFEVRQRAEASLSWQALPTFSVVLQGSLAAQTYHREGPRRGGETTWTRAQWRLDAAFGRLFVGDSLTLIAGQRAVRWGWHALVAPDGRA